MTKGLNELAKSVHSVNKMKTFVLTVSIVFPATHKRKGEETQFPEKILAYLNPSEDVLFGWSNFKIHTIRSNYELWKTRIEQVQKGEAILSIRYWSGKPYNSKQVEICQLDKDSGIGVQKLAWTIDNSADNRPILFDSCKIIDLNELSRNDGLSLVDFKEWFKGYNFTQKMAIIHFTKFRY